MNDTPPAAQTRVVGIDVVGGWMLGALLTGIVAAIVAGVGGWDLTSPTGSGATAGRAITESATDQPIAESGMPLTAKVAFVQPALWVGLAGVPWLVTRLRNRNFREDFGLRMEKVDVPLGLVVGVATQLVLVPLLYWPLGSFIDKEKIDDVAVALGAEADAATGGWIALFIMVVIGAPIIEEIAYRGGLMRALNEKIHPALGIGVSALIFGVSHLQLISLPALVLFGVVAGVLAWRADRIGPALWAHVGFNLTAAINLLLL